VISNQLGAGIGEYIDENGNRKKIGAINEEEERENDLLYAGEDGGDEEQDDRLGKFQIPKEKMEPCKYLDEDNEELHFRNYFQLNFPATDAEHHLEDMMRYSPKGIQEQLLGPDGFYLKKYARHLITMRNYPQDYINELCGVEVNMAYGSRCTYPLLINHQSAPSSPSADHHHQQQLESEQALIEQELHDFEEDENAREEKNKDIPLHYSHKRSALEEKNQSKKKKKWINESFT
jgi:hypothetical protein